MNWNAARLRCRTTRDRSTPPSAARSCDAEIVRGAIRPRKSAAPPVALPDAADLAGAVVRAEIAASRVC
jgi:hypothetical protein